MTIYCVNASKYFINKEDAIEKAKEILRNRQRSDMHLDYPFSVTETNKGLSVILNAPWDVVGNSHLLAVIIKKIQVN